MNMINKRIFELHAEICKTLANPKRLEIINILKDGEKSVNELVNLTKVSQSNISQHLTTMRQKGIVAARRAGKNIYYKLAYPEMVKACEIIRGILQKQLKGNQKLAKRME